jgi:glycyl-tRNA synthetase alpha chain
MYLQEVDNVFDLKWNEKTTYGDIHHETEVEFSKYNFDEADISLHFSLFEKYEGEALNLLKKCLVLPAYDFCLKCSHSFNILDARGAISVTERTAYIARVRHLARKCAEAYLKLREEMGFPFLKMK